MNCKFLTLRFIATSCVMRDYMQTGLKTFCNPLRYLAIRNNKIKLLLNDCLASIIKMALINEENLPSREDVKKMVFIKIQDIFPKQIRKT